MAGYKSKQKTTFFAKNKQSVNDSYRASNFKLSFQYSIPLKNTVLLLRIGSKQVY